MRETGVNTGPVLDDNVVAGRPKDALAGRNHWLTQQVSIRYAIDHRDDDAVRGRTDFLSETHEVIRPQLIAQLARQQRQAVRSKSNKVPPELLGGYVECGSVRLADAVAAHDKGLSGQWYHKVLSLVEDADIVLGSAGAQVNGQNAVGPVPWQNHGNRRSSALSLVVANRSLERQSVPTAVAS